MTAAPKHPSGSSPTGAENPNEPFDYEELIRQIDEDVGAKRESDALPSGFERELDALFSRYAPATASEDFDAVLDEAARRAAIEGAIPVESNRRGGALVKQGIARTLGWYHAFLAEQLIGFSSSITHAVRLLGRRTEELEAAFGASLGARKESEGVVVSAPPGTAELVVQAVDDVVGRVLVAECGDAEILAALAEGGADCYGVDPRRTLVDSALGRGLDVHPDRVREHLSRVEPESMGAVVLTGFVERCSAGEQMEILELALTRLDDGGRLVVASRGPVSALAADPVAADLAPGRALHPRTWVHLLAARGWESRVEVTEPLLAVGEYEADTHAGRSIRGGDENGGVDEALATLSELLGPAAYVVTAVLRSP